MNLTNEQKELLKKDEENGVSFESFINKINIDNKEYFNNQEGGQNEISFFFILIESGRPPAIRLRYLQQSNIDERIKIEVITKYKEIFGIYADYQVIEN